MDRLDAMSIFLTVVETGSLSAAARHLSIPLTTVSRKVSDLESYLRTQLLIRSSRRITLAEAGRSYAAGCRRILDSVAELERAAAGEYLAATGKLTVTAPIILGRLHLVPVLADFLRVYPDIDVRLTVGDRSVNLLDDGIDVALRVGDLPDSGLVATRVGTVHRVFAASRDYVEAHGAPRSPADLVDHACIGVDGFTGSGFWTLDDDVAIPVRFRSVVNATDAACDMARSGLGIVSVFAHQVDSFFRDGSLCPILLDVRRKPVPVHLVRLSGEYLPLKLRAFLDFVGPRLKARLQAAPCPCDGTADGPRLGPATGLSRRPGSSPHSSTPAGWRR